MASYIPSQTTMLSTYSSIAGSIMIWRTLFNQLVPQSVREIIVSSGVHEKIMSKLRKIFRVSVTPEVVTVTIDKHCNGGNLNEVYEAAEVYLASKIGPSNKRLKVSKAMRDKTLSITINNGERIVDCFDGIEFEWVITVKESQKESSYKTEKKSILLNFEERHKEMALESYIPFVLESAKKIQEQNRIMKLNSGDRSITLQHPSTFDTLAMDLEVKKALIDDLDRFVKRKDFYRRVGKVWKRGYLLYGPPGTGKSSLIAAMANYLKFHIYDFELSHLEYRDFRQCLISTANRSIIVIEDIDCSTKLQSRLPQGYDSNSDSDSDETDSDGDTKDDKKDAKGALPLAGLLNFIDGLWSSCDDERIIVFTTNHKDKLDPALLRPGRMDMHIHMSYLTFSGFKVLASNYLGIDGHPSFTLIEALLAEVQITPEIVAEELMKGEDVDKVLDELSQMLLQMKEEGKTTPGKKRKRIKN